MKKITRNKTTSCDRENILMPKMSGKNTDIGSNAKLETNSHSNTQNKKKGYRGKCNSESNEVKKDQIPLDGMVSGTDLNHTASMTIKDLPAAIETFSLHQELVETKEDALQKSWKFWNTQPVPKMNEKITKNEPIEPDRQPGEIRYEPYSLPDGFEWDTLNLDEPLVLRDLCTLLNENCDVNDDCKFKFNYQPAFLKWALQPPGWRKDWHCGVRVIKSRRLIGFISAIPATLKIYDKIQKVVIANFLCVHKKLRSKRVAPVLIREITRRVHLVGIFQAVYVAGIVLPKPIATCKYWHRPLNPRKLIEVEFLRLGRTMTMQRTCKLYKLPDQPKIPGFRKLTTKDVPKAHRLLKKYLKKFELVFDYSEENFIHWFMPQNGIVDSFVVENNGKITDFVSYYTLQMTVMHHPVHKTVKAAYCFYNVSKGTPWIDLMNDALIAASQLDYDVFIALDMMDNKEFFDPLKFSIGNGSLKCYLYNWRCPIMPPSSIGLVWP